MHRIKILGLLILLSLGFKSAIGAQPAAEPGWTHGVVLFGEARKKKDATPILEREYRPFHFYGNTVRRQYYRGTPVPSIGDGLQAARATVVRRQ
jgi:hypothetical protein